MDDFQNKSKAFLDWFNEQSNASLHEDLELTDLRSKGAGRGILARKDIPAHTELFSIPRDSILSVENSQITKRIPNAFSTTEQTEEVKFTDDDVETIELPDPWIDLILVMVYEFLQGSSSRWHTYFDVLPQQFDTLMFWHDDELSQLQASAIRSKIGKDDADEMFRNKVAPVVREHADAFYPPGATRLTDEEVIRLAHRMGSIIMAYAFELEKEDDDDDDDEEADGWAADKEGMMAMGMVPMADMLNADAEFNAHLNHDEDKLTMTSIRPIKAGEEVLNFYGPLPNCELLRRYGYTSSKHHRYDVVEISWETIKSAMNEYFQASPSVPVDDDELEDSFVLERDTGYPEDNGLNKSKATFTGFEEELESQTRVFIASAMRISLDDATKADRRGIKTAFLEIMAKALPARLQQYATTAAEDEAEVKGGVAGRRAMAIDVRLGEKRLLQEACTLVGNLLERYRQSDIEEGQPQAKKQKTSK